MKNDRHDRASTREPREAGEPRSGSPAKTLRGYFDQRGRDGSWSSLYEGPPTAANYNFLTRRAAVAQLLRNDDTLGRVLDVGCGTGDYAEIVRDKRCQYVGADYAPAMVRQAHHRQPPSARFIVAAGEQLPFADDSFDLVLGLGFIAYFADPAPALAEIRRVLRPGGTVILQTTKPDLFGTLDRRIWLPLRSVIRRRAHAAAETPEGWVNVRYSGAALDRLARGFGLVRVDRAFNHFNVGPWFLRRRFPDAAIRASEFLTQCSPGLWRFLAVNYIARYSLASTTTA